MKYLIALSIALLLSASQDYAGLTESFNVSHQPALFEQGFQWRSFRHDFQNSGFAEVNETGTGGIWRFKTDGIIWGTPLIDAQENIYIGSSDKYFYSLDNKGALLWKYRVNDTHDSLIDSSAALTDSGKVIVPGGDGYLHALNSTTGKLIWAFRARHATEDEQKSGSIVNSFEGNAVQGPNGLVYAGSDNGHMYAVTEDGEEAWNFKTGMMVWSAPVFSESWMAFGSLDSNIYFLEQDTGKIIAKFKAESEVKASLSYDPEKNILFAGDSNGIFHALRMQNNEVDELWSIGTGSEIYSSAAYSDGKVFFGSVNGRLYCADYDGNILWEYNANSPISSSPVVTSAGDVVFGAKNGKVYCLDMNGTRKWSYKTSESSRKVNIDSSPSISAAGNVYFGSYDSYVYKLPLSYCEIKWDGCEFGGESDDKGLPDMEQLALEGINGNNIEGIPEISLSQQIMVKFEAADSKYALRRYADITISPEAGFFYRVSADGKHINIFPEGYWKPDTSYIITINAEYYKKSSWIIDSLRFFGFKNVNLTFEMRTKEKGEFFKENETYLMGMHSVSLFQPEALDTLIPAGLDGQKFIAAFRKTGNVLNALIIPASKDGDVYKPLDSRRFLLNGTSEGNEFRLRGKFELSAMGGTIPVKDAVFSGYIENGIIKNGEFFMETNCLSIKGNAGSYEFPVSMASQVCDSSLNLVAVGMFEGEKLRKE